MRGKTIKSVTTGEINGDDVILLKMTDDSMYLIQGGISGYGDSMVTIDSIKSIPKNFVKHKKDNKK